MTLLPRTTLLNELAVKLVSVGGARPLRVAIDGRTASGKTTLADELAGIVQQLGREVIRTSIDGFHQPKAKRYARGRHSAEGYYHDARDLSAVCALLLDPLGPGGDRRYRTASFDLEKDVPIEQEALTASASAVLIVDGTFLQRPELCERWDLTIFVETSEYVSEQRGIGRDADRLGGLEVAQQLYANRYRLAFDLYDRLCAPAKAADVRIHNDDFEWPRLVIRPDGRLA